MRRHQKRPLAWCSWGKNGHWTLFRTYLEDRGVDLLAIKTDLREEMALAWLPGDRGGWR